MQIVINLDKELCYEIKQNQFDAIRYVRTLYEAVKNGIPLPKGHGRLIDADEIQFENVEFDTYGDYCRAFDAIDQAEPIIEADKEQTNGNDD